jgi:hypothetical protein
MNYEQTGIRVIFTYFISFGYLKINDTPIVLRPEYQIFNIKLVEFLILFKLLFIVLFQLDRINNIERNTIADINKGIINF